MCGICGFLGKLNMSVNQLEEMNDTMCHRGPNDHGAEISAVAEGYTLGLAQRRLAIMDLSPLGHQPMHSFHRRYSLVFNGEIYNFQELREELRDYPFASDGDTEVILAAFEKWGIEGIQRFNGMFAIAIFDRETQILYLIRDRIGKKPLYYWKDGEAIWFASELKPLMKAPGFPKQIQQEVVGSFLYQQYVKAPYTIFENVYKVESGTYLTFHKGTVETKRYWGINETYQNQRNSFQGTYEEAKDVLREKLTEAVRLRMIADVPVGTFLSGGYDSSLITAMAGKVSNTPVETFSIGFLDKEHDEAIHARAVSNYLGTKHTECYMDEKEMLSQVESIANYYDEPFADSSQIPSMLVSQLAAKQVCVALSGDGGDEFFCGYQMYDTLRIAQKLDTIGEALHNFCEMPGIRNLAIEEKLPYKVKTILGNRMPEFKTQMEGANYASLIQGIVLTSEQPQIPYKYLQELGYGEENWQIRRMLLDMDTYLPDDILTKVDRASMKYSLETRCPILDQNVMEFALSLPHAYRFQKASRQSGSVKKRILKDLTYAYIPKELLERPKSGFSVPLDKWLRGPLEEKLWDYAQGDFLRNQGIFDVTKTQTLLQQYRETGDRGPGTGANYSRILWAFYVFQQWYQTYLG